MNESTTDNIQFAPPREAIPKMLLDMMAELGSEGYHVMVRIDPVRERKQWTLVISYGALVEQTDTENPLAVLGEFVRHHRNLEAHKRTYS